MSTDVLLIAPPSPLPYGSQDIPIISSIPFSGVKALRAFLCENGYNAKLYHWWDERTKVTESFFSELIGREQPRLLGFSTMTDNYLNAVRLAKLCREACPETRIIVGGPHVSFTDRETLQTGAFDIVVRGEGENTLLELVEYYVGGRGGLSDIKGISYIDDGGVFRRNPSRRFIQVLDELPFPYTLDEQREKAFTTTLTGRGCPGACKFCVATAMSGGKYRERSAEGVVDECFLLSQLGLFHLTFLDDTFTGDLERLNRILLLMEAKQLNLKWAAESRVDIVDEDPTIFQRMAKQGCSALQFGLESGSQQILDSIGKGTTLSQIRRATQLASDANIQVVCSMMIGAPEDTVESIEESLVFVGGLLKEFPRLVIILAVLTPYPGTYITRNVAKMGIDILPVSYDQYSTVNPIINTRHLTAKKMRNLLYNGLIRTANEMKVQYLTKMKSINPNELMKRDAVMKPHKIDEQFILEQVRYKDTVFVELKSNVLKRGLFLGLQESAVDPGRKGICISPTPAFNVIEWIDIDYIREIQVV